MPRSFVEALQHKYVNASIDDHVPQTGDPKNKPQTVWISGKEVEEIGYQKINQQQGQLENLRIVIVDGMQIVTGTRLTNSSEPNLQDVCPSVTDLDLGRNLFETLHQIASLCEQLKALRTLTLEYVKLYSYIVVLRH